MPIAAKLYLDTTASPEEVKAHLLRTMPFYDEPDFEQWKELSSDVASVQIGRRPPHRNRLRGYPDPFRMDYKITVYLFCRRKTDPKNREQYNIQSGQAVVSLLKRFAGDAVLIMYEDVPVLVRKDGALRLMYTEGDVWDARAPGNRLSLVDLPYTLEPLDLATL